MELIGGVENMAAKDLDRVIEIGAGVAQPANEISPGWRKRAYLGIKRFQDVVLSALALAVLSPILLLIALAVVIDDPKGGPFFSQIRCGRNGKAFRLYKFRTMCVGAEERLAALLPYNEMDGPVFKIRDDPRITRLGKFLRSTGLDELPQLVNILRGDMSFIGPRPERPEIIAQYMEVMPEFAYRMKVKAGLAGFAQVYGKYNTTPYDKLKLDLTYIENYTVWLDIKLMLLTLKILFWPDSTEGIDGEQITALREEKERQRALNGRGDEE